MTDATTRDEARDAIRDTLHTWKDEGVHDPTIAVYNSDGSAVVYGLTIFGQLEERPDTLLSDTVSVSDGAGIETDRTGADNG